MTEVLSPCQITLSGEITADSVQKTIIGMHNMVEANASSITLCIDSIGGIARGGFELYDFISNLKVPVTGIVTGRAESMALVVLQACNKRLMMREATVLAHHISIEVHKRAPLHVKKAVQGVIAEYEERLITVLLEKTKLGSGELVESFLDARVSLTSQQALELGFVDDIIDA